VIGEAIKDQLLRDGHILVGNHSSVHVCNWTEEGLLGRGSCFKEKFGYGVESHRCMQMTPSAIFCTNNCLFCWCLLPGDGKVLNWRRCPFPLGNGVDDPETILTGCIEARSQLLTDGFTDMEDSEKFQQALTPNHVAVCLSGEPTLYPHLSQLFESIRDMGMSSHLVTNGTNPAALQDLKACPDLLFVSLYAPDEETYQRACRPGIAEAWPRLMSTLELLPNLPCKTIIELTLIQGLNMKAPRGYAEHILRASPQFVDVKAFAPIGRALRTLGREAAPSWPALLDFVHTVSEYTGYGVGGEFPPIAVQLVRP